jgi:hypothetical protein
MVSSIMNKLSISSLELIGDRTYFWVVVGIVIFNFGTRDDGERALPTLSVTVIPPTGKYLLFFSDTTDRPSYLSNDRMFGEQHAPVDILFKFMTTFIL